MKTSRESGRADLKKQKGGKDKDRDKENKNSIKDKSQHHERKSRSTSKTRRSSPLKTKRKSKSKARSRSHDEKSRSKVRSKTNRKSRSKDRSGSKARSRSGAEVSEKSVFASGENIMVSVNFPESSNGNDPSGGTPSPKKAASKPDSAKKPSVIIDILDDEAPYRVIEPTKPVVDLASDPEEENEVKLGFDQRASRKLNVDIHIR